MITPIQTTGTIKYTVYGNSDESAYKHSLLFNGGANKKTALRIDFPLS